MTDKTEWIIVLFFGFVALLSLIAAVVDHVRSSRAWRDGAPERAKQQEQKDFEAEYEEWKLKHGLGPDKGGVGDV